jgi:hypothetical protein
VKAAAPARFEEQPLAEPVLEPIIEPAAEPVDEGAPVVAQAAAVAEPEPVAAPARMQKPRKPSVAAVKARVMRAAQRAVGVKPKLAAEAVDSPPPRPRGEPLREVRLEVAAQTPAPAENVVEERQLTGLDMRRLGL